MPGNESGRLDVEDRDSTARRALRGVLYVPKVIVQIVLAPFQLPIWAYDRYHLKDLYYRVFYNEDRTIGLIPTASYATEFGFTVGAKLVLTDLAGERESLWASAQFGGTYQQDFDAVPGWVAQRRSAERFRDDLACSAENLMDGTRFYQGAAFVNVDTNIDSAATRRPNESSDCLSAGWGVRWWAERQPHRRQGVPRLGGHPVRVCGSWVVLKVRVAAVQVR